MLEMIKKRITRARSEKTKKVREVAKELAELARLLEAQAAKFERILAQGEEAELFPFNTVALRSPSSLIRDYGKNIESLTFEACRAQTEIEVLERALEESEGAE